MSRHYLWGKQLSGLDLGKIDEEKNQFRAHFMGLFWRDAEGALISGSFLYQFSFSL
jgi:hypothetical protein